MATLRRGRKLSTRFLEAVGQLVLWRPDLVDKSLVIEIKGLGKVSKLDWERNTVERYVRNSAAHWCRRFGVRNKQDVEDITSASLAKAWQKVAVERKLRSIAGVDLMVKRMVIEFNRKEARSPFEPVFDVQEESERLLSANQQGSESRRVTTAQPDEYMDPRLQVMQEANPAMFRVAELRDAGWSMDEIGEELCEDPKQLASRFRAWLRKVRTSLAG